MRGRIVSFPFGLSPQLNTGQPLVWGSRPPRDNGMRTHRIAIPVLLAGPEVGCELLRSIEQSIDGCDRQGTGKEDVIVVSKGVSDRQSRGPSHLHCWPRRWSSQRLRLALNISPDGRMWEERGEDIGRGRERSVPKSEHNGFKPTTLIEWCVNPTNLMRYWSLSLLWPRWPSLRNDRPCGGGRTGKGQTRRGRMPFLRCAFY